MLYIQDAVNTHKFAPLFSPSISFLPAAFYAACFDRSRTHCFLYICKYTTHWGGAFLSNVTLLQKKRQQSYMLVIHQNKEVLP